jgi:hypothetical protein
LSSAAGKFVASVRANKSLDASGGSAFLNLIGPAMVE